MRAEKTFSAISESFVETQLFPRALLCSTVRFCPIVEVRKKHTQQLESLKSASTSAGFLLLNPQFRHPAGKPPGIPASGLEAPFSG